MAKLPSKDLIQDITTRFILTAPADQLAGFESIMFLVEQAHWYYEDFVRESDSALKSFSLKDFATVVFRNCPELQVHLADIEQIMEHFKAFKKNVPVMGGILLDNTMQRVLLVKGWKNTACWGFPRGKIHQNENDVQCAVREVLEETGYDIESLVNENDYIELTLEGKRNKLYIVAGLDPDSAQFAPKCKGEIGGYAWHKVADLPCNRDEGSQTFLSEDGAKHKFYMVWPYIKPLRKWIRKQQYNNPSWDMPLAGAALDQPQRAVVAAHGNGDISNEAISMHKPYYPQQVQHLLSGSQGEQQQQYVGSPQHPRRQLDLQQGQWHTADSKGSTPAQLQQHGVSPGGHGHKTASRTSSSNHGSLCGPLAALFGAAAATAAAGDCPKTFRFNRQAILQEL